MKHLSKPEMSTKDIILACASSYRSDTRDGLKNKLIEAADHIHSEGQSYDNAIRNGDLAHFVAHDYVNENISTADMCDVYDNKFVKVASVRNKYYDKLMATATTGKCPICGISQVSNLDHYLAKTIYPIYAVTPYNLTPICRDCNFAKLDADILPDCAPLHPYYDEVDSFEWLKAALTIANGSLVAEYYVNPDLSQGDEPMYRRLKLHMEMYSLAKAYSIQAATEISESCSMWIKQLNGGGEDALRVYLSDCLASKERCQRNTWNTALLRALIEDVSVIGQIQA